MKYEVGQVFDHRCIPGCRYVVKAVDDTTVWAQVLERERPQMEASWPADWDHTTVLRQQVLEPGDVVVSLEYKYEDVGLGVVERLYPGTVIVRWSRGAWNGLGVPVGGPWTAIDRPEFLRAARNASDVGDEVEGWHLGSGRTRRGRVERTYPDGSVLCRDSEGTFALGKPRTPAETRTETEYSSRCPLGHRAYVGLGPYDCRTCKEIEYLRTYTPPTETLPAVKGEHTYVCGRHRAPSAQMAQEAWREEQILQADTAGRL